MSWVWNVLLSFSNEELWEDGEDQPRETCEPLERINQWIPHGELVSLTGPTYMDGVGYGLDANLFGGGFKNFDIERFIEVVEAQSWKNRAKIRLLIKGGQEGVDDEPFEFVKLCRPRSSRPANSKLRATSRSKSKVSSKRQSRKD